MPEDLTPEIGTDEVVPAPVETPIEPLIEEPDPVTDPIDPAPAPAADPELPSVEERYRQSSSEAMILNSKNKNLEDRINKLTSEDTPADDDLIAAYPEFATYNAVTQQLMRDTLENKRRQMRINRQLIEQEAERRWEADLRALTRKPEYSGLRGDEKFEEFVLKPQHTGVDIHVLADAYIVRTGKAPAPAAPSAPTAPVASSGLPRGSGGPRGTIKPSKVTLEQAKVLRETNWKEYMRQMRAGNIEELE